MVRITREDIIPERTFMAKIPLLNIIEELRIKVVEWIWKEADIRGISADNILKAGFVAGIALILVAVTLGNIVYGLLAGVLGAGTALIVSMMLTGYGVKYFIEPKIGRLDKVQLFTAPVAVVATVVGTAALTVAGPYITPIANFFAGLVGAQPQAMSLISAMLTVSSMIVKSQVGAVTVQMIPVVGSYFMVAGTLGLGNFLEWIVDEFRSLGRIK